MFATLPPALAASTRTPNPLAAHESDALLTPTLDPSFRMANGMRDYVSRVMNAARGGSIEHLRMVGPAGCGKTEAALQCAALGGMDAFVMDCSIVREPRDWFGSRTVSAGTLAWRDSAFVRAVQRGNTLIVLDEANRASLTVGNALLPLLDRRRASLVEERGSVVRVAPGTVFVATMNEGAGYTGTSPMDAALRDRFPRVLEFTYLPEREESALLVQRTGVALDVAERLVDIATRTRATQAGVSQFSVTLSTRQLLAAAADYAMAGSASLPFTIGNLYPTEGGTESERAQIMALVVGKFGTVG
jgi:nitric oxide reductase NorQ protein